MSHQILESMPTGFHKRFTIYRRLQSTFVAFKIQLWRFLWIFIHHDEQSTSLACLGKSFYLEMNRTVHHGTLSGGNLFQAAHGNNKLFAFS